MAATQGSMGSVRPSKTPNSRRAWSEKEELVLLACLKDVVAHGLKSDNGFRAGYMKRCEAGLLKAFPGTDLKADPHINSRIQVWKKNYASLVSILKNSGTGFNLNGDHKVDCSDEQWEEYILLDNNAKKIRGRSWPLFEGWKEVFGKDRATGEIAEDVTDAVNVLEQGQRPDFVDHNGRSFGNTATPDANVEEVDDSVCQSTKRNSSTSQRNKKKKTEEGTQSMCDLLERMHQDINATLQTLASRIGVSADLGAARKQVFNIIKEIPGLSSSDNFKICDKLIGSAERLEFFMGLPAEDRQEYVFHMLNEHSS